MKIGVVGCGNISDIYFKNLTSVFNNTEVLACADLDEQKALAKKENLCGEAQPALAKKNIICYNN